MTHPDTNAPGETERGPLTGIRVLEFAGLGPAPYACMQLSDMGADVVCVRRPQEPDPGAFDLVQRGRRSVRLDLKTEAHIEEAMALVSCADVLVEGFRPGVMERLGLGPDATAKRNPRLVYARMTGWGQNGPLAAAAGHDINYVAITGALDSCRGPDGTPVAPLNLLGDYGGGALFLVIGILAAYIEAQRSGQGQVVDAAMCDGVTNLLTLFHGMSQRGTWRAAPRANMLDGGAHFYQPYECADGRHIAVGAIEPQFYAQLRKLARIEDPAFDNQSDRAGWPRLRQSLAAIFATKTRNEWVDIFKGSDACVSPVLTLAEARADPHLTGRDTFLDVDGASHPAPAPRFLRTPSRIRSSPAQAASTVAAILADWRS